MLIVMKISVFLLGLFCGCFVGMLFGIIILVPDYYNNAAISCMNSRNAVAYEKMCAIIKMHGGCDENITFTKEDFERTKIYGWRLSNDNEDGTLLDACRIRLGINATSEQCIQSCCNSTG